MNNLTFEDVLSIHSAILKKFGGSDGILNEGSIKSALNSGVATFDGVDLFETDLEKCVRISYGLIEAHGFVDGNKRVGALSLLVLFEYNGIKFNMSHKDLIGLVISVADGKIDYDGMLRKVKSYVSESYSEEYDDDFTFKKTYGADIEYCPVCKGDLQVDEDGNLYCPECGNVEKTARKKVYHEDKEDYVLSFERDDKDYEVNGNKLTGYVTYTLGEHIPGTVEVDFTCHLDEVDAQYEKSGGEIVPYWGSTATLPEYNELVDVDAKGATTTNFKYFVNGKAVNEKEFVEKVAITNDELAKIKDKLLTDTNEYIADTIFDSPEMLGENLKEGIISGNDLRLTSSDLAKLEKELYEYLRKEWNLYPSDGTFNNAKDDFSDLELTLYVDGDWKHDHLATQEAVKEFCDKANLAIINHEQVEIGESDSDSYEAKHTWKLAFDEDDKRVSNKIAGFKKMFEDTETANHRKQGEDREYE